MDISSLVFAVKSTTINSSYAQSDNKKNEFSHRKNKIRYTQETRKHHVDDFNSENKTETGTFRAESFMRTAIILPFLTSAAIANILVSGTIDTSIHIILLGIILALISALLIKFLDKVITRNTNSKWVALLKMLVEFVGALSLFLSIQVVYISLYNVFEGSGMSMKEYIAMFLCLVSMSMALVITCYSLIYD